MATGTKQAEYTEGDFEVEFLDPLLSGTIGMEYHEEGEPPSRIIDVKDDLLIDITWSLRGSLVPYLCGCWCVQVCLECMCGIEPYKIPAQKIDVDPVAHKDGLYSTTVKVPGGTVKVSEGDCATPCWFVVCITFLDKSGKPGAIAGFVEGPMLQFYDMGEKVV